MYGDNGALIDAVEVGRIVAGAEVFILSFAHLHEALLVDCRSNDREATLIQVVDPLGSGAERVEWLRRRRPSLGKPLSLSLVAWPHSAGYLVESGIWDRIRHRLDADSDRETNAACDEALRLLRSLDTSATQAFLRGDHCHDLWPRPEVTEGRI